MRENTDQNNSEYGHLLRRVSDITYQDFMKLYKDYTRKPYSFSVNDATVPSDNPLRFRKNVL